MSELNITKENFESQVLQSDKPVLIDFWASWCGPCRMLAPTIEQIAKEYQGQFVVGKINVDEQPELSSEFGIMSIPTLMVFKEGKVVATQMGVQPKPVIEQMLKNA